MFSKAANSVELLNGFNIVKEGDTHNYFHVRLIDSDGVDVLTAGTEITWSMFNLKDKGTVIANKVATLGDPGTIYLYLAPEDVTGYGRMGIEISVTYADGTVEKFPADKPIDVIISKSSDNLVETPVSYASLTYLNQRVTTAETAATNAQTAAVNASTTATDIQTEFGDAKTDADGMVYPTVKDRVDAEQLKIGDLSDLDTGNKSSLTNSINEKGRQIGASVESFGAIGDGVADDTQPFIDAVNFCNDNQINLELAGKPYLIKGELPFPNRVVIRGKGHSTNLILNLQPGQFAFKALAWVYSFGIEGLRFSIASGASKDVGAINTDFCLRGAYVKNIWSFDLYTPFYFGNSVWGILAVDNVFAYLNENINDQNKVAFYGSGNTIMTNNLEIIGGWKTGLQFDNVFVTKIHKFNIAGSSDTIQLREAIVLNNCSTVSAQDGWIEQLDDVFWSNGKGWAVYASNSPTVTLDNILVNSGAVYSDNSNVKSSNIEFSQVNGGFRTVNNGTIQADLRDIRYCDFQNGEIIVNGINSLNAGHLRNPIFKKGIPGSVSSFLTSTNGGFVTLDYFHTDYISGDASVKATVTVENHGYEITTLNISPGELYTVVVKVKKVSGLDSVKIVTGTDTTRTSTLPSIDQRNIADGEWHTLSMVCSSSTNTLKVRVLAELSSGSTSGVIVMDSAEIFRGYNNFDPSKHVPNVSFNYKGSKPSGSGWTVGDKVYNSSPSPSGYEGWVCTVSDGVTSTWKGFGLIES